MGFLAAQPQPAKPPPLAEAHDVNATANVTNKIKMLKNFLFVIVFLKYVIIFTVFILGKATHNSKTLLLSPLDWGLGHTTRCIPIIQYFIENHWDVVIACTSYSNSFYILQQEFPQIKFENLRGYGITYTGKRKTFAWKMMLQIPRILRAIANEKRWLNNYIKTHSIDLVISDNRYGFSTKKVPSIFMTHQLEMIMPFQWLKVWVQKRNYSYVNQFAQCWVPDAAGVVNIAGSLSHPKYLPKIPLKYIGPLSRLGKKKTQDFKYRFLCVMSGPEPQRTILENKLIEVATQMKGKFLFVRGLPNATDKLEVPTNCEVVSHLSNEDMKLAFAQSEFIVSRSGYTTVMELLSWNKKSILIPTPGQTEQEYLGKYLMSSQLAFSFEQENVDFVKKINEAQQFSFQDLPMDYDTYKYAIRESLQDLCLDI
ncbi:glycosyltransferase [Rhizosphaericola mali]|uniref:UDP-N-acetylglucosamine--N-acetylmuramyl-(Pentapeptide) pyrophosphoryl-undecaprenol N-acetylglucosamine transferase n=1 Tax=Rhizosphaericola mali TaxID=2545455 RepID=A0A5P2G160_9BACT|nr:glycosyltransferase [Rhizosphaericola mali]QES89546.1 UDP-N-acetylglucosamine--N-acetylmuramyl-(pentapeptide) pyrophosphoryl-undecaprenol N-acetylglucosamine transferase [Rhizosphaericola mali]